MYRPNWEGEIEGYVVNFLKTNHWRVARSCGFDDATQEAYVVFLRCAANFASRGAEGGGDGLARQFMAMFKTYWYNRFTDLANDDSKHRVAVCYGRDDGERDEVTDDFVGCTDNDGALAVMIRQAPREVSMVLSLFLNAPQELLDAALASWRGNGDRRAAHGGSRQVNRLLGLPDDQDTMKAVADYFAP